MDFFQFTLPTKIIFNEGISSDFSQELEAIPAENYIVVTDAHLIKLKLVDPIINGIKNAGKKVVAVFSDVPSDSGVLIIEKCAALAKEKKAEGFIAIGGGSVMDTAKGANILFTLGGNLIDDYSGAQTITQKLSPLIAIPTTAGTGSEVTEALVVFDEKSKTKISLVDSHLLPTLAVLDPLLTLALPPLMTAATSLDALTHAIESMMSIQKNPASNALALHAIQLIHQNILKTLKNGNDIQARSALLVASTFAGIAFNHSMVGVVHAVSHTIGALFKIHHGTANGIFLPFGMEYNFESRTHEIASMLPALNGQLSGDDKKDALNSIKQIRLLLKECHRLSDFPLSFSEVNIPKENLHEIAEKASFDGASFYNPREVNYQDLLHFLLKAY